MVLSFGCALALLCAWLAAAQSLPQAVPQTAKPATASLAPAVRKTAAAEPVPPQDIRAARQAFERGQHAEQAGNWNEAFEAYGEAAAKSPNDRAVRLRLELARFALVQQDTQEAARDILSGKDGQARERLQVALRLDPGYTVAREQLAQLGEPATAAPIPPPGTQMRPAAGPPQLKEPLGSRDFDYSGTTRGAYEEIARQFGVTATFDGDLPDRQIRFRAPGVDFHTAMRLLAEETTTFWTAVDPRTFFVTPDSAQKRRDYDPEIEQTIDLPDSETLDDMTETTRLVRDIVGIRRSQLDAQTHRLTLRDTPDNVALARALVQEIEQARGEVLLEIDVLEVDRTLAQQLGITPPSGTETISLNPAEVTQLAQAFQSGTLVQALQSIFGSNPLTASGASMLPPLIALGGGKSLILATVPGATADFSRAVSAVRSAQRVLLRVADGKEGTFFVGERYPITLALLSSSLVTPATQFTPGILPGTFPSTNYDVGTAPASVVVGDFNGDGKPDLAVVNKTDNTVSILLGNGDGTFGAATTFPTGMAPIAVVTSDFNGDGKLDLAVVNQTDDTVSILLGNGDGTFQTHVDYPTGTGPVAIAVGEFNAMNNSNVDLAVVNKSANTVSLLFGNGDGTFGPKTDLAVGAAPSAIVVGDFNNDGFSDLAVTNSGGNTFSVVLGRGNGTFTAHNDFTTGNVPSAIAAADFNADGRLDVAVTNQTDNTLSIYPGNGDGTFSSVTNFDTGATPVALAVSDFNSDGLPDLVAANEGANTISVFLNLGAGNFVSPISLPTGEVPVALAASTLDNTNTLPDVVAVNQNSNNITVILNTATIPTTSSNAATTSYPGAEYVDLGLQVKATPRLHPNDEVTLSLQFDIKSLSGQNVNGIPILSNRTVQQTVRLKENQTSVLSGIMQSSELKGLTGLPGLANVPGLGQVTADRSKQESGTELLIAVTPRQLRLPRHVDSTLYAGRGPGSAPLGPTAPGIAAPGGQPAPLPGAPAPGAVIPPGPANDNQGAPAPGAQPTAPQSAAPQLQSPANQPGPDRPNNQ
jgi:type II secretory pathway component GspD/PulD (secretin)